MEQRLKTRFTDRFDIRHPVMLAPMDIVSGGRLAAAVSAAGGLGLIGGGYADPDWVETAFQDAGNQRVGVGFITWAALKQPRAVERALAHSPAALMVSFGDAEPLIDAARGAGAPTIWQIQRLAQAEQARAAGVDVIVVQGQEAGGHGMDRGLTALLPAVRDLVGPEQILLAAGGIADGRGLAAALMLGADGVMMGTRFWASAEASGTDAAKAAVVAATGDGTLRTKVFDVTRGADWPWEYTGRVVANAYAQRWRDDIAALQAQGDAARAAYAATDPNDFDTRVVVAGESVDLISAVEPAAQIVARTVAEAADRLDAARALRVG